VLAALQSTWYRCRGVARTLGVALTAPPPVLLMPQDRATDQASGLRHLAPFLHAYHCVFVVQPA
jgi:hypothetical protein